MNPTTPNASCCGRSCTCAACTCSNGSRVKSRKLTGAITLRRDRDALQRLAPSTAHRPTGETPVAEHEGALVAAVSLDRRTAIADPFRPTAGLVALLRTWSNQVQVAA